MARANAVGESNDISAWAQAGIDDIGPSGPMPFWSWLTSINNSENTMLDKPAIAPATWRILKKISS